MIKTPQEKSFFQHQSFEEAYRKLALPLTKFLIKRLGGKPEAVEEVFSQTMTAAWKGWNSFEHKSSYFTWICRIALNKMADYYRDQVNQKSHWIAPGLEVLAQFKSTNPTPEEKFALEELVKSVRECLDLLPEDKKQLLYLRFWKEYSIKRIAEVLEVSERAAEGKIYRAKLAFREAVEFKYPYLKNAQR